MRIILLIGYVFFCFAKNYYSDFDAIKIRDLYYKASANEKSCKELEDYIETTPKINAELLMGYKGISYMLKAKYLWNPIAKLNYFKVGKGYLDKAIKINEQNVELRFLRFAIQSNAPSILNYSDNLTDDKKIILVSFSSIKDTDLKQRIKNYIISCDLCTNYEKSILNK